MSNQIIPTHIPFLDKILGGGQFARGVHGVLGPTGIGKTHLATMIAVSGATGGTIFTSAQASIKPWVLFDIASPADATRQRCLFYAARGRIGQIDRVGSSFEAMESNQLTVNPEASVKGIPLGERLDRALEVLSNQLHFSSSEFAEISSSPLTQRITDKLIEISHENELGGIVIDGVSDVWGRVCDNNSMSERQFIAWFAGHLCREFSNLYKCPVWMTHQINGAACAANLFAPLSHRNAARCKTFADNLDACVVMGTQSESGYFNIQCTKHRLSLALHEPLVIHHAIDFVGLEEVPDLRKNLKKQNWELRANRQKLIDDFEIEKIRRTIEELKLYPRRSTLR